MRSLRSLLVLQLVMAMQIKGFHDSPKPSLFLSLGQWHASLPVTHMLEPLPPLGQIIPNVIPMDNSLLHQDLRVTLLANHRFLTHTLECQAHLDHMTLNPTLSSLYLAIRS